PHPCPYLPDHVAAEQGFVIDELDADIHRALLDRGFRRSGRLVYRPVCPACRKCTQIRVPVNGFTPSRSQRRVQRRNADLTVTIDDAPRPTDEKWRLFSAYLASRHDRQMPSDFRTFVDFLYDSPTSTIEAVYRLGDRLAGVSILDVCEGGLSSVYMYYDPELHRRSLGTFSVLWEIDHCRRRSIPYYYIGFYVPGARTMAYKAQFQPHQTLDPSQGWIPGRQLPPS
ncbi:MAG: arginyltransferase, partial [Phycisphaerales bacterium]|nr:arginyltransferase [Phycisphaerales bacterium]